MRGLLRAGAGVKAHRRAAQQALQANQPEVAIGEYQAVLTAEPQNPDAELAFHGQTEAAIGQYREALKIGPSGLFSALPVLPVHPMTGRCGVVRVCGSATKAR